ncbi:MAG: rod-binding protein [candidate division Zixibacteria bacterium]|nr:rod-binding protein [candidate division Zixibacteria bacterium]
MPDPTLPIIPNFTLTHATPRPNQPGPSDPITARDAKLRKAASEFESLFLTQLLKTMQSTINKTKVGNSFGGEVMQDVASEKFAENLARKGGVGLGDMIYNTLKRHLPTDTAELKPASQPIPRPTDIDFHPLSGAPVGDKKQ